MSAEILRRAATLAARRQDPCGPAVAQAASQLLAAVARELEQGGYTVESDVIPTWLHCELDNLARAYLGESE